MQINWSTIGEKVYSILKGSSKSVSMYDAKGNSTIDPEEATRFFAIFKSYNKKLDTFTILVACHDEGHDSHIDIKTPNVKDSKDFRTIHQIRNHIRKAIGEREGIKVNWLVFDHAINPKDEAINNVKESFDSTREGTKMKKVKDHSIAESKDVSKVYGTTKSSFQQIGEAKLIIRHSAAVNENVHGARSRQIRALFVENKIGERFAYPHLHVSGARAFARHISNGGTNHDAVATKLFSLSEDYMKLRRSAHSLRLNESANPIWVERLRESMNEINRTLKSMHGPKGYKNITASLLEETSTDLDETAINTLRDDIAECCGCPTDSPMYGDLGTAAKYISAKGPIEEPVVFSWKAKPDISSRISEFSTIAERLNWQLNELATACTNEDAVMTLQNIAEQIANGVMPNESSLNLIRRAYESSQNYVVEDSTLPEEAELNEYLDKFNEENIFSEEVTDEGNAFSGALAAAKATGKKEFDVDGKKYKVNEDGSVEETGCNMTAEGTQCPQHGMAECMSAQRMSGMDPRQDGNLDELTVEADGRLGMPDENDIIDGEDDDDYLDRDEDEDYGYERDYDDDDRSHFADPGGQSALRAATADNPRIHACPTCGHPNRLTRADVSLGYQCDKCADATERGGEIDYYEDPNIDHDLEGEAPPVEPDNDHLYESQVARLKNLAGLK